jgi:hypothetical protein
MRQLTNSEVVSNAVAGAGVVTYPPAIPGYEIVGWEQTLLYYREESRVIEYGFFKDTVYIVDVPVYDIQPIYAPIVYYIV